MLIKNPEIVEAQYELQAAERELPVGDAYACSALLALIEIEHLWVEADGPCFCSDGSGKPHQHARGLVPGRRVAVPIQP
jgi:hypothetical protein